MDVAITTALINSSHIPLEILTALNLAGAIWPPQAVVNDNDIFDYVVIGAGCGAVVANRLTENNDCDVLLVEAGDNPSLESVFPGLFVAEQNSYQDWKYKSEPEEASQSQSENVFKTSAGKTLGGSSAINHFINCRGSPFDFDSWADLMHDESWKYENILRYFIKSETMDDKEILESPYAEFHGTNGPIKLTREPQALAEKYLKTFEEVGNPTVLDLNGNNTIGYAHGMYTIGDNVRQSTAQAYLRSIKDRKNLHVLKKAQVIKILFDENKNAIGVKIILEKGNIITVKVKLEIIVSAGVFNSPKLLKLSGIGPKEELEELNITVISDLPVGKGMQDHLTVLLVYRMEKSLEISELPQLTRIAFPTIVGAVALDKSQHYPDYQTLNYLLTHDSPYLAIGCATIVGYKNNICQKLVDGTRGHNHIFSLVEQLRPKSRGEVKLRSTNPNDAPIIKQNFLTNDEDINTMVKIIQDFVKVENSAYFKSVNAVLVDPTGDECNFRYGSIEYWTRYIKEMSASVYHQTSTCAMGNVVDNELKVYGVQKLRVIDASVMPNITRANPLDATIMIAEKISDIIKRDNRCECKCCDNKKECNCKLKKSKAPTIFGIF